MRALVTLAVIALLIATALTLAFADHAVWPIVHEKQIEEGTNKACVYHRVERCTGLSAPLPRLARVASEPCQHDPTRWCLPGAPHSGGYDPVHRTIILASGKDWDGDEALRHEMIHSLRDFHYGDPWGHGGDEWRCQ